MRYIYILYNGEKKYKVSAKITTFISAIVVVLSSIFNNSKLRSMIEQKGMTFDHDFGYSLPL